jgi:hypothetical protein
MTSSSQQQSDSIASWTIADLDARVIQLTKQAILEEKRRQEKGDPLLGGLVKEDILSQPYDQSARPFWEVALEMFGDLPDEVWSGIPTDASAQVDHYLYDAPKDEA